MQQHCPVLTVPKSNLRDQGVCRMKLDSAVSLRNLSGGMIDTLLRSESVGSCSGVFGRRATLCVGDLFMFRGRRIA